MPFLVYLWEKLKGRISHLIKKRTFKFEGRWNLSGFLLLWTLWLFFSEALLIYFCWSETTSPLPCFVLRISRRSRELVLQGESVSNQVLKDNSHPPMGKHPNENTTAAAAQGSTLSKPGTGHQMNKSPSATTLARKWTHVGAHPSLVPSSSVTSAGVSKWGNLGHELFLYLRQQGILVQTFLHYVSTGRTTTTKKTGT